MTNPLRATIIPSDGFCSVDGVGFTDLDMSSIPPEVHAVQWYATWGEEERMNLDTREMLPNVRITSLDAYSTVFGLYWAIRNAVDEAQAAADAEAQIVEI